MEVMTMYQSNPAVRAGIALYIVVTMITLPVEARAYVDPGTTGMLSQVLYVLFYGALGVFLYLLRYVKQYLANAKQFLSRLFGGGNIEQP
jgi:hypothetical protein